MGTHPVAAELREVRGAVAALGAAHEALDGGAVPQQRNVHLHVARTHGADPFQHRRCPPLEIVDGHLACVPTPTTTERVIWSQRAVVSTSAASSMGRRNKGAAGCAHRGGDAVYDHVAEDAGQVEHVLVLQVKRVRVPCVI